MLHRADKHNYAQTNKQGAAYDQRDCDMAFAKASAKNYFEAKDLTC